MFKPAGHDPYGNWAGEKTIGETIGEYPFPPVKPERTGYELIGWKCPDGSIKNHTDVRNDIAYGNSYYIAQWQTIKHTVTFNVNEHTANIICTETDCGHGESDTIFKRTYEHND